MTPLRFEAEHAALWDELLAALDRLDNGGKSIGSARRQEPGGAVPKQCDRTGTEAARMAAMYRKTCEHLALAQARSYPVHLIDRLERLTQRAHQAVYQRSDFGWSRLARLFTVDFPAAVRRRKGYVLTAGLLFAVPTIGIGIACYLDPTFILTIHDASSVVEFDTMYGGHEGALGRRDASTDWAMFGYYIKNNISVAFQCFAGGIFGGLGSILALVYNGVTGGSVAGYLTWHGHATNFYSFVVTHGAFELTAIVIAGAAGLMLGHALLAPGRRTRLQALRQASVEAVVLIYGVIAMLVVAAALEAFWSSSRWVGPAVKYGVGAACWAAVLAYLVWQGRPARPATAASA